MNPDGKPIELAAGVILFDVPSARVLLIKDSKEAWRFPSGRVELNESFLDAAIRELQEETGILRGGYNIFLMPIPLVRYKQPKCGTTGTVKITTLFSAHTLKARTELPTVQHESKSTPEWLPITEAVRRTGSTTRSASIELSLHIVQSFAQCSIAHSVELPEHVRLFSKAQLFST